LQGTFVQLYDKIQGNSLLASEFHNVYVLNLTWGVDSIKFSKINDYNIQINQKLDFSKFTFIKVNNKVYNVTSVLPKDGYYILTVDKRIDTDGEFVYSNRCIINPEPVIDYNKPVLKGSILINGKTAQAYFSGDKLVFQTCIKAGDKIDIKGELSITEPVNITYDYVKEYDPPISLELITEKVKDYVVLNLSDETVLELVKHICLNTNPTDNDLCVLLQYLRVDNERMYYFLKESNIALNNCFLKNHNKDAFVILLENPQFGYITRLRFYESVINNERNKQRIKDTL
jgi:hypothetical protein